MKKKLVLWYGVASYLLFFGLFGYLIGFLGGFLVTKTVDSGEAGPVGAALLVDLGLILLFGLQHSLMARKRFKRWLQQHIPRAAERSTYVLASTLAVILLIVFWQPLPQVIWQTASPVGQAVLYSLFGLGVVGILFTSFQINHFDLFGLRQVYLYWRGKPYQRPPFVRGLLYRWVRNPMHTATLIFFLAAPRMTLGHLLLGMGMAVYTLIGIYYEERDLERALGDTFRAYKRQTPSLLPNPLRGGRKTRQPVQPGGEIL